MEKTKIIKILLVGGTFNNTQTADGHYGKRSGLVDKLIPEISRAIFSKGFDPNLNVFNGGSYDIIDTIFGMTPDYDIVFWFANVDNSLPKIRDVKAVAPRTMLVTSKRNDNGKYSFQELIQRALASKSNLVFEFNKIKDKLFNIHIFDPLGCEWYNGTNLQAAADAAIDRLLYLKSITRQSTTKSDTSNGLVLSWYFDSFKQDMQQADDTVAVPDETKFIELVRSYAEKFHEIMQPAKDVKRFLGNCSTKQLPPQVGRCSKGMPSFKTEDYIFVSQRNVNKEYLDISHFVPVYEENGKIYYCGDNKPSVDTPIQLRLYKALPNIRYMIHSHCYAENAVMTTKSIPCGAIEEVDEVLQTIDKTYGTRDADKYIINLKGHGSIIMGKTIDDISGVKYFGRKMPEKMWE